jgi:hypothetical protein
MQEVPELEAVFPTRYELIYVHFYYLHHFLEPEFADGVANRKYI